MSRVTAITGGIGAGKSVVSRILRAMGYPVYDSDLQARMLMDADADIHAQLCRWIHPEAVTGGIVNRPLISSTVFANPAKLERLNAIVHPRLVAHFRSWVSSQPTQRVFIETAILHQCPALHPHIQDVWLVEAPDEVRIDRVMLRSGLSREQVKARIIAQAAEPKMPQLPVHRISNAPDTALLPQIHALL